MRLPTAALLLAAALDAQAGLLAIAAADATRCRDCRMPDATFQSGPSAPLIAR